MSTRGTSTAGIARATGVPWEVWTRRLDELGARGMEHAELARHVARELHGVVPNHEWWAQAVTVAYEQHTGAREPGQSRDGSFAVSAGRTVPGTREDALERWGALMAESSTVGGVPLDQPPTTSTTGKWCYWRARLADGTRVSVTIGDKAGERATIGVAHTGLGLPEDVERWRAVWRDRLRAL